MREQPRSSFVGRPHHGELSRRAFVRRAAGVPAASAAILAGRAAARDASPQASPVSEGGAEPGGRSMNREEYYRRIHAAFDFSPPEATGGRVVYGEISDIDTLNPQLAGDGLSGLVTGGLFETLAGADPASGLPAPGLADYWELSADGLVYTFHLNPSARWHDGVPLTAEDVVFSFDSILDSRSLSPYQSSVAQVVERYRAVDDHTFELVARDRFAVFIGNSAQLVAIVPRHIWADIPPRDWGSDPGATGQDPARVIGSGPFRFVEWITDDHVTLARNADYWDPEGTPVIDELVYRVIPEASAVTAALRTGEIDIGEVPFAEADDLDADPDIAIQTDANGGWNWYDMNQDPDKTTLFVDRRVRQATMHALDREAMAELIYLGYAQPAHGPQPPTSIAYAPHRLTTIYEFDPEKARALLDAAGWVDDDGDGVREKDGKKLRFECLYSEGVATFEQQLPYMQQAWNDVGIAMVPRSVPFTVLIDTLGTGGYEMAIYGFGWGAEGSQGDMFRCDAVPPSGFNTMHYCNPRYDALDARQMTELVVDKRIDLLVEQSNIVNDDLAAGVILFRNLIVGSRTTLHNFLSNGHSATWSMPWWWTEVQ